MSSLQLTRKLLPVVAVALVLTACAGPRLMPTPNIFLNTDENPFANVPEELRTSDIEVLFATDRFPKQKSANSPLSFGSKRSGHLHVGLCRVRIGKDLSWPELEKASLNGKRGKKMALRFDEPNVLLRYPGTFWRAMRIDDPSIDYDHFLERRLGTREALHFLVSQRMKYSDRKEVFIFMHGYNNSFEDSVRTIANMWHFMGRVGVPVAYTWPAGAGGLTGYTTDRESGEFTVLHLKMFLEDLAAHPGIEKIHILAHSRGTDITLTALREMAIAVRARGDDPREVMKIGNLILASPDIDMEVASQRLSSELVPEIPERLTIYLSPKDRALRLSSWLQGSWSRLGLVDVERFQPAQLQALAYFDNVQMIDSRVSTDFIGHGYFYSNPAVSSDVVRILRDNLDPGTENGRPLVPLAPELWRIHDDYPAEYETILGRMTSIMRPRHDGTATESHTGDAEQ